MNYEYNFNNCNLNVSCEGNDKVYQTPDWTLQSIIKKRDGKMLSITVERTFYLKGLQWSRHPPN